MNGGDKDVMEDKTVRSYIDVLQSMFVIEDLPAWNPNLKSKTAIRTADTHYFVDPSIAAAAMGIGPGDLMNDLKTFGFMFETLCIRDLRVYSQPLRGDVYHYRDKNGLECDAVVHLPNGNYGLIEIKLGGENLIEEGAATLKRLASKIDVERMKLPSFMMVLTAVGAFSYRRKDGVLVVPITTLGA
jgi:predicted AAA+ superfamily ATPase